MYKIFYRSHFGSSTILAQVLMTDIIINLSSAIIGDKLFSGTINEFLKYITVNYYNKSFTLLHDTNKVLLHYCFNIKVVVHKLKKKVRPLSNASKVCYCNSFFI